MIDESIGEVRLPEEGISTSWCRARLQATEDGLDEAVLHILASSGHGVPPTLFAIHFSQPLASNIEHGRVSCCIPDIQATQRGIFETKALGRERSRTSRHLNTRQLLSRASRSDRSYFNKKTRRTILCTVIYHSSRPQEVEENLRTPGEWHLQCNSTDEMLIALCPRTRIGCVMTPLQQQEPTRLRANALNSPLLGRYPSPPIDCAVGRMVEHTLTVSASTDDTTPTPSLPNTPVRRSSMLHSTAGASTPLANAHGASYPGKRHFLIVPCLPAFSQSNHPRQTLFAVLRARCLCFLNVFPLAVCTIRL